MYVAVLPERALSEAGGSADAALTELGRDGHISRTDDAWVLHGEPPKELYEDERRAADHSA
jgi:hypothetical protein